jgi:hypothetical protein
VVKFTLQPLYSPRKTPFIDRRGGGVSFRCDLDILEMTKISRYARDGKFNAATRLRTGRFGVPNNVNSNKWACVFKHTSLNIHNAIWKLHP